MAIKSVDKIIGANKYAYGFISSLNTNTKNHSPNITETAPAKMGRSCGSAFDNAYSADFNRGTLRIP